MLSVLNNIKNIRVPKFIKYDFIKHIYQTNDSTKKYYGVENVNDS